MEKTSLGRKVCAFLGAVLLSGAVSLLLCLLLAFLLLHFDLTEAQLSLGITVIYGASCLVGGFAAGKSASSRRFLRGFLLGGTYVLTLTVLSCAGGRECRLYPGLIRAVLPGILCGTLGGMLA